MVGGRNVPPIWLLWSAKVDTNPDICDAGGDSTSIHGDISVPYSAQTLASRGPAPSRHRHLDTD